MAVALFVAALILVIIGLVVASAHLLLWIGIAVGVVAIVLYLAGYRSVGVRRTTRR